MRSHYRRPPKAGATRAVIVLQAAQRMAVPGPATGTRYIFEPSAAGVVDRRDLAGMLALTINGAPAFREQN